MMNTSRFTSSANNDGCEIHTLKELFSLVSFTWLKPPKLNFYFDRLLTHLND